MFYYLISPFLNYNLILIAAAVVPAIFLMIKVYRSDRLEKESPALLWKLVKAGVLSSLLALVEEKVLSLILDRFFDANTLIYNVLLYFVVVAVSEESSKYIFLKRNTWRNPEFNCSYDGVIYAVFVSLGFAIWENISYVLNFGFTTALVRAVTAIPGHACFGVFMGIFYALAKSSENRGNRAMCGLLRKLAVIMPAILHGIYDFIASMGNQQGTHYFLIFVAILFIVSYILVGKASKRDRQI